jgi:hypothetical protein
VPGTRDSKDEFGARNKIYRSFKEGETRPSFSFQKREMTPGPSPRYEKPKTTRGYSNPRTSREK